MDKTLAPRGVKGFFMGLLPSFEKKHLDEGIDTAFHELESVHEMYGLDGSTFADATKRLYPNLEGIMRNTVPAYRGDFIRLVRETLEARKADEGAFRDHADKLYNRVILKDNMDYTKVYTLRYVDGLLFFTDYARKLLLSVVGAKVADADIVSPVDRMDVEYVNDNTNMRAFCMMLDILQLPFTELKRDLSRLDNVQFKSETHDNVMANEPSLAGIRVNFLPVVGHVTIFLGKLRNTYVSNRLEAARLEKEKLQVKLLLLRRMEEESDKEELESLQKQIKFYNNRLNKVSAKIEDILEDA